MNRVLPLPAALLFAAALSCGCASTPATEFERPEFYPDFTSAALCWQTYLWAWRHGDVETLKRCYMAEPRVELEAQLQENGAEAVADYYRRDARRMHIAEARWTDKGEALANIVARFEAPDLPPREVKFSLVESKGQWSIWKIKPLR